MSNFILHCGAVPQTYEQLQAMNSVHYEPQSPTHRPVAHHRVADMFKKSVAKNTNYSVVWEKYGVSGKKGTEMFGALGLRKDGNFEGDYEMFMGFRHSNSQKFSLRGGIGDRFFICDNMSFLIEAEIPGTKHTKNISDTAQLRIDELSRDILQLDTNLHNRNNRYRDVKLSYAQADHLMMECVREGCLQKTKITAVDGEWRKPSFKYNTTGKSMLDLKHAFTHVAKNSFYGDQIKRSQGMHKVFDKYCGILDQVSAI